MKKIGFVLALFLAVSAWAVESVSALQRKLEKSVQKKPSPAVENLTIREQVGQTIMPRVFVGQQALFKESVLKGEVTGFFVKSALPFDSEFLEGKTPEQIQQACAEERQKLIQTIADLKAWAKQSRHHIPLLFAIDYEGGTVTSPMYLGLKQMPSNMLLAATGDPQLVADMYAAQAGELRAVGAGICFFAGVFWRFFAYTCTRCLWSP